MRTKSGRVRNNWLNGYCLSPLLTPIHHHVTATEHHWHIYYIIKAPYCSTGYLELSRTRSEKDLTINIWCCRTRALKRSFAQWEFFDYRSLRKLSISSMRREGTLGRMNGAGAVLERGYSHVFLCVYRSWRMENHPLPYQEKNGRERRREAQASH